jgi:transcriptional antiterminator Rof (Rho-off)
MKPLNSKERAQAFYKVTGWFVFCFALAMLLGYCTMNVNNYTDYASRKQLEELKNDLSFQEKVFQPNIGDATKNLVDLPKYKEKNLIPANIASSINVSLENIKKDWNEKDPMYIMYKNIVDTYYALELAYLDRFSLENEMEQKDRVTKAADSDLNRDLKNRDNLAKENESMKLEIKELTSNLTIQQSHAESQKIELGKCRDSLKTCIRENKILRGR